VVSRRLERHFRDLYGRETVYIPNGVGRVAMPNKAPLADLGLASRNYMLFADRLVPESGCHLLLDAADAFPGLLVIAETGPGDQIYRDSLIARATPTKVVFAGPTGVAALDGLMAHAHLFVLPSVAEEPPTTLLQALAHGRAVVVSDVAGHLDMVGADGFTFTSGEVGDLCRVLAWLAHDEEVVTRMEVRAAATATTRYNWDRIAESYEQVFASVL
jgi:glycosyltransferase involved in cell wall biosynthesis